MKHVASGVIVEFMKSLYITEDGDHKVSSRIGRERVSWQTRRISKLTALPATEKEVHRYGILAIATYLATFNYLGAYIRATAPHIQTCRGRTHRSASTNSELAYSAGSPMQAAGFFEMKSSYTRAH